MRRLFAALLATSALVSSASARPGGDSNYNQSVVSGSAAVPTYTQGVASALSDANYVAATMGGNITAGHLVIVSCVYPIAGGVTSTGITDSSAGGNTWTQIGSANIDAAGTNRAVNYYSIIATGAFNSISCQFSTTITGQALIILDEYSNILAVSPTDGNVAANSASSGTVTTGTLTTSANGDLIYAWAFTPNSFNGITAGSGYAGRVSFAGVAASEDKVQTSAGGTTASFGNTSSSNIVFGALAFKHS